ncbi:hypothetical protein [Georgenia yuyongxinii]
MNGHEDQRPDDARPPRSAPGVPRRHSEFATHGDPSRSRVRGQAAVALPDVDSDADASSMGATTRAVPWVRPSELPMAVLAQVLGQVVDRTLTAQSNATRIVVRAPAVAARATARRVRARRAAHRTKGLGR